MTVRLKDGIETNASTATKLSTARKINGVAFDGTKDITINAMKADSVDWNNVQNKPSVFAPSTHDHNYIGDSTIKMYAHRSNEINFGGSFKDNTYMFFGYRDIDGRPAPTKFVFGKDMGSGGAEVYAKDLYASGNKVYHSGNKPSWNDINGKPSVFNPSPHTHDDSYVTRKPKRLTGANDLNAVTLGGNYAVAEAKNAPCNYGRLVVLDWDNSKWCTQIFYSDIRNEVFTRCATNAEGTTWTPWSKVYSEVNKPTWNDVTGKPSTFTPSSHNHDDRYFTESESDSRFFRNYMGTVTDFNNTTNPGRYYVFKEGGSIPNAPYTGNIYGSLEVFKSNDAELIQRFTEVNGDVYTRLRKSTGEWWKWFRTPTDEDFKAINNQNSGYQKLPSGIIIQWGSTVIPFDGYRAHGYLYYPIAFKEYVHCCGNVASNDYGCFCETTGTIAGDNLSRAYAEALDVGNGNRQGHNVRFQWIAIGR